jgi:DNA polymerase-3 subunit delta
MVAVPSRDAEAFVKSGFTRFPIILVFGPDEGLVSERAESIAKATTQGDAASILRLDGDDLAADPMRLADEANAMSMFGGTRAIRIRLGARSIGPALEPLLKAPPVDARIIIEAGDIKPTNALRSLIEKDKGCAAVPCYGEDVRDVARLLDAMLGEVGLKATAEARAALIPLLGQDRKQSRSEIEKLFLYCRGAEEVTLADVEAVVTDAATISADALIDAAFLGKLDVIETEARRVLADGNDPGVLLGFALRHVFLLQSIKRGMQNQSAAESIKSHRVNWKREKAILEQVDRWIDARLERSVQLLADAVYAIRRAPTLGDALAIRALWSLALAVTRR